MDHDRFDSRPSRAIVASTGLVTVREPCTCYTTRETYQERTTRLRPLAYRDSSPARQVDDEQNDADQEQNPRNLPGDRGDAEQSERAGHEPHDQEDERVVDHPISPPSAVRSLHFPATRLPSSDSGVAWVVPVNSAPRPPGTDLPDDGVRRFVKRDEKRRPSHVHNQVV